MQTKFNAKPLIRNNNNDIHIFSEIWLKSEYDPVFKKLKPGFTVIDVGAHIGLFTLYAKQRFDAGKVFAFEPSPTNFELLKKNIDINKLRDIVPFQYAVAKEEGKQILYFGSNESSNSLYGNQKDDSKAVEVITISLKNIIEKYAGKCDLLKLDCEGAEYEIMLNIPPIYLDEINNLCIEYHDASGNKDNLSKMKDLLQKKGYDVRIENEKEIGLLFAIR